METTKYKVYPYRWVILISMIPILAMTNVFWLTFAPVTSVAVDFYKVTPLSIAVLSMSYMIVYVIMSLPASYLVDTRGFKASVATGAIVTAVFGMLRGIFADNFTIVSISQFGIAIGQPFLVNAITKVAARWFPVNERATASGIATMAGYLGMVAALSLTPGLTDSYGIGNMLMIYGYASVVCALIFLVFSKERPPLPPGPGEELVNSFSFSGIAKVIKKRNFVYLLICIFVVMGIFNAVMTWIEDMLKPRGISPNEAGIIGGILVIVGLAGAVILPSISDKIRKRRPLLFFPVIAAIPGFIGMSFSSNLTVLFISSAVMGFFVMGMGPIAFQYGAEVAYPVAEGTSFGLLMGAGQISGIIFIYLMDMLRSPANGDMTTSLIIFIVMMIISVFLVYKLEESPIILGVQENPRSLAGSNVD